MPFLGDNLAPLNIEVAMRCLAGRVGPGSGGALVSRDILSRNEVLTKQLPNAQQELSRPPTVRVPSEIALNNIAGPLS